MRPYGTIIAFGTGFVACCYGFGVYLFGTIAPDMRADLDLGPEAIGLASGSAQAGLMVVALMAGVLAHRIGYLRLILLAQALNAICLMLVAFCTDRTALVALLTLLGGASSALWVPMVPLTISVIPRRRQGTALGVMAAGTSYGVLLNGLFAAPIVARVGWRPVWIAAGGVSLALFAAAMLLLRPLLARHPRRSGEAPGVRTSPTATGTAGLLRDATARKAVAITAVNGIAFLPFQTYLTSLFRDGHGWSAATATSLWSAVGLAGLGGGLAFGALSDRIGARRSLVIAYAMLLVASLVVVLADHAVPVFASALLFGLAYSGIFGLMATYVARSFEAKAASPLIGMSLVALGLGSMVGNYAGGIVIARSSYTLLYGGLAALVGVNVVLSAALPHDGGRTPEFALSPEFDR